MTRILVGLRGYKGVHILTHECVSQLKACPTIFFESAARKSIAGIAEWRSLVATDAYRLNYDGVLFVDDDITFNPLDVLKLVNQMKELDVIGIGYVTRGDTIRFSSCLFDGQKVRFSKDAKPLKLAYLSGGFMLVSKKALHKIAKKEDECYLAKESLTSFIPYFMPIKKKINLSLFKSKQVYLTEDYSFCERARNVGLDIWIDPSMRAEHIGEKLYRLEHIENGHEPEFKDEIVLEKITII